MAEMISESYRILVAQTRGMPGSWPRFVVIVLTGFLMWVMTRPGR